MAEGGVEAPQSSIGGAMFVVNYEAQRKDLPFKPRPGAESDYKVYKHLFVENLGFQWLNEGTHLNLNVSQWDHKRGDSSEGAEKPQSSKCCLRCKIESYDFSGQKAFVLTFSSHGRQKNGETYINFIDGDVSMSEIYQALSDECVPSLKGIPRIIMVQACRTEENAENADDEGHEVTVLQRDDQETCTGTEAEENIKVEFPPKFNHSQLHSIPMPTNFLVCYATAQGRCSKRKEGGMSCMENELQGVISEYFEKNSKINFLHLFVEVTRQISQQDFSTQGKKCKNVPTLEHRLTTELCFEKVQLPPPQPAL